MAKELKKVDEFRISMGAKIAALNSAYKGNDGLAVDRANKELFKFMDTVLQPDNDFYVEMKNYTWQKNHMKILAAIAHLMQTGNHMPTNAAISSGAGLSEETIYKHLRGMEGHELYKHEGDKFKLMKERVLATVFNLGVQGDVRACKVYLDYFSSNNIAPVPMPAPTNFIQINNLKITPDELQKLPSATLQKIETLIKMPVKVKRVIQLKN